MTIQERIAAAKRGAYTQVSEPKQNIQERTIPERIAIAKADGNAKRPTVAPVTTSGPTETSAHIPIRPSAELGMSQAGKAARMLGAETQTGQRERLASRLAELQTEYTDPLRVRSRGMLGRPSADIQREMAGIKGQISAINDAQAYRRIQDIKTGVSNYQALSTTEKESRWIELAGLDRPLTDSERAEAKEAIRDMRQNGWEASKTQLFGTPEEKAQANSWSALAAILENKTSPAAARGAGLVTSFPFATKAIEDGNRSMAENGTIDAIYQDPRIADVLKKNHSVADTQAANPVDFMVGSGAGELTQMLLANDLLKAGIGAAPLLGKLPTAIQNSLSTAGTMGTLGALDTAEQGGSAQEVAKSFGVNAAAGGVGGLASEAIGALGTNVLFKMGMQNAVPAVVLKDALAGAGFAGGSMGTRYALDENYRPTGAEAGKEIAVAALFGTITSLIHTLGGSAEAKARMQQDRKAMAEDYAKLRAGADARPTIEVLNDMANRSASMRATLASTQYVGQQKTVNEIMQFLDAMDGEISAAMGKIYGSGMSGTVGGGAGALSAVSPQGIAIPKATDMARPGTPNANIGTTAGMAAQFMPKPGEANSQAIANLPVAGEQSAELGQKNTVSTGETGSTSVNTNPAIHTPAEQAIIDEYQNAVDDNILGYYQSAVQGETKAPYYLKPVSDRAATDIMGLVDRNVSGFSTRIDARQAEHIYKDHGDRGRADHSMADPNDVARIQYVLDNYDSVTPGGQTDAYWEPKANGRMRQAKTVVFAKKVNGTYYVVEAVPISKAKSVNIVSAYMLEAGKLPPGIGGKNMKTESPVRLPDAFAPWFTAKTDSAHEPSVLDSTIPPSVGEVKKQYMQKSGEQALSKQKIGNTSELDDGYWKSLMDEYPLPPDPAKDDGYWSGLADEATRRFGRMPTQEDYRQIKALLDNAVQSAQGGPQKVPLKAVKRENVTGKALGFLTRAENQLTERLANALSVPKAAGREYLSPIVKELADTYLETGSVDRDTYDRLFETAYQQGIVTDDTFYKQYQDLGRRLRETPVTISETDMADIPDFEVFRKSNFGKLRIVKQDGTPVDVLYSELAGRYPELFDQEITAPSDQLRRFSEVAGEIKKVRTELSAYYGEQAEEFRGFARESFDEAAERLKQELGQVRRYVAGREAEAGSKQEVQMFAGADMPPERVAAVEALWKSAKELRKNQERAVARNLLTEEDERIVGRLLRGEITLNELPKDANANGVRKVYEAKLAYQEVMKAVRLYNQNRKAALRAEAEELLEGSEKWRDKQAGILYSVETMERNIRDIVGDKTKAEKLIDRYLAPVHRHEAERTKMRNQYRDRVRALDLSRKPSQGNRDSDAYAVQFLGEVEDNIAYLGDHKGRVKDRNGGSLEDWQGARDEFLRENPNLDMERIQSAIQKFRDMYDELFRAMNAARIRNGYEPVDYRKGYFPHFSEKEGDGILYDFARVLGIRMDVEDLPTTINGITHTFKPGIRWSGNVLRRTGNETVYDAVEGMDRYLEGITDVIWHTDDIQSLRALAEQARYRSSGEAIKKRANVIHANEELDDLEKRGAIEKLYEDAPFGLSNFVVELEEYTNLLANKKSMNDRNMEHKIGRRWYNAAKALESRVAANMVALNPASWLTNFIPLAQGGAELKNTSLLSGMWDTLRDIKESDGFVSRSTFLTNRKGSEPLVRSTSEQISSTMSKPMEWIDQFTAGSLVRARYKDNRAKGMAEGEAMEEADAWAASVMADRSKGSLPTIFESRNPGTKLFTQFQLEVKNQLSHLFEDVPSNAREGGIRRLAIVLLKFMVGAYLFNEVYEHFIGRRPALDPIGMLNDTIGDFTGYQLPNLVDAGIGIAQGRPISFQTEKAKPSQAVAGLGKNLAEELPFVGGLLGGGRLPIGSAIPDITRTAQAVTKLATGEGNTTKQWSVLGKELAKPLYYVVPPFGGGQIKKAYEGISAILRGGSYSTDSEGRDLLQYPVYTGTPLATAGTVATAALFGKTALPTAREWIGNGFKSSTATQTAVYQALIEMGTERQTAYDVTESIQTAEKEGGENKTQVQNRRLQGMGLAPEEKAVVYYGMLASDSERELMDQLEDAGANPGGVYSALSGIRAAGALKGSAGSNAKRTALMESGLTDEEKIAVYRAVLSDSRDEDIRAATDAGLVFDEFLDAQNNYTAIQEGEGSATEKGTAFARWINENGFTSEQREVLRKSFRFMSFIPNKTTMYEKLMEAGLEDEIAYQTAQAMEGLKPYLGKDQVSAVQKSKVIVQSDATDDQKMQALSLVMTESDYNKAKTAYFYDVSPALYVEYREAASLTAGEKNVTQEIAEQVLNGMLLTVSQKAVLWQLQNSGWKASRNPYSVSAGEAAAKTYAIMPRR